MHEPRWLDLQGAVNGRDVGKLPATGNRHTLPGVLFRCDAVHELTDADVALLTEQLGVRHVLDLRAEGERRDHGRGRLGKSAVAYSELDVLTDAMIAAFRAEREATLACGDAEPAVLVADGYWKILEQAGDAFVLGLERLAGPDGTPALVHCTAGKDRTGLLVALLLDAAGVHRDAIVADYAATEERMAEIRRRLATMPAYAELANETTGMFMTASAAIMEHLLDRLHLEAGGAAEWFIAAGASPKTLDAWRATILPVAW